ncbi:hypothetical protein ACFS2C_13125 [Prauserella oleivorans]|uniref:LapA family protein n=1 Tax=Prauserella oleivorans TaxID=1478153 RepID=A0ABW5W8P7_9PSEU
MLWLFGQIWLWLLLAFALGAGSAALVLTRWGRPRRPARPVSPLEPAPQAPPEEETRHIPVAGALPSHRVPEPEDATEITTRQPAVRAEDTYPDRPQTEYTGHTGYADIPPTRSEHRNDHAWRPAAEAPANGDEYAGTGEPQPLETGYQSGTLPSWREWHARNEWPDEQDVRASEYRTPRRGG